LQVAATAETASYNIARFGATPDGRMDSTAAWSAACRSQEPATVSPTNGHFLLSHAAFAGPCSSRVALEIDGTLIAPSGYTSSGGSGIPAAVSVSCSTTSTSSPCQGTVGVQGRREAQRLLQRRKNKFTHPTLSPGLVTPLFVGVRVSSRALQKILLKNLFLGDMKTIESVFLTHPTFYLIVDLKLFQIGSGQHEPKKLPHLVAFGRLLLHVQHP
jgi:hypothetical protein